MQSDGYKLDVPPIVRVPRDESCLCRSHNNASGSSINWRLAAPFIIPSAINLSGVVNVDAFEQALNEIVRRHEILRTTISQVPGEPQQVISPAAPFRLLVIDLSDMPHEERQTEMMRLISEEAELPFDLMLGPQLRVSLVRISAEEHIALLTRHHIVFDGWSTAIFVRELAVLYTAYCAGQPSPLEDLPIQYADFAYWQRQWFQGDVLSDN